MAYVTMTSPAPRHSANPEGHKDLREAPLPYRMEDPLEDDKTPSYRELVNGIIPGYDGHIPRGQHQTGKSKYGTQIDPLAKPLREGGSPEKHFEQKGHPNTKQSSSTGVVRGPEGVKGGAVARLEKTRGRRKPC